MTEVEELALLLRPAGGGVFLFSTGRAEQEALQRKLYGAETAEAVQQAWLRSLEKIRTARGVLLAVPSDVGAGFQRGANLGPQAIRVELLKQYPDWPQRMEKLGLIDVGDVFVVPQLQHDAMLSEQQLAAARRAIYPSLPLSESMRMPVSPLSICERAWELMFRLNPKLKPFAFGGDHSTALPLMFAMGRSRSQNWGIVQSDAHTDLLEERLGVKYCFATWSWHANQVVGRKQRLVQVGTRASGKPREHWEKTCEVRQFWANEVRAHPQAALDAVVAHVKSRHLDGVFFSNDIDGTSSEWADATGTPEPHGLEPDWLVELIRRLGREVGLLGGDVMEVAPPLRPLPDSTERTVSLAARYFVETAQAALG
jgi:arginase family enzyme